MVNVPAGYCRRFRSARITGLSSSSAMLRGDDQPEMVSIGSPASHRVEGADAVSIPIEEVGPAALDAGASTPEIACVTHERRALGAPRPSMPRHQGLRWRGWRREAPAGRHRTAGRAPRERQGGSAGPRSPRQIAPRRAGADIGLRRSAPLAAPPWLQREATRRARAPSPRRDPPLGAGSPASEGARPRVRRCSRTSRQVAAPKLWMISRSPSSSRETDRSARL